MVVTVETGIQAQEAARIRQVAEGLGKLAPRELSFTEAMLVDGEGWRFYVVARACGIKIRLQMDGCPSSPYFGRVLVCVSAVGVEERQEGYLNEMGCLRLLFQRPPARSKYVSVRYGNDR